jgi:hypothetical protein
MSYNNGPRIVTNGLVLYLDAGNTKSYPGSGTTWTDLSGNSLNATLTNGPTYSSANCGNIVFDGTNDHVLLPTNFFSYPSLSAFTISLWFRSSQSNGGTLFGQQNTDNPSSTGGFVPVIYLRSDGFIRIEPFWTASTNNFILSIRALNNNVWHNITTTFSNNTNQLYIDGIYNTQRTGIGFVSFTTTYYYILGAGHAAGRSLGTNYFSGNISHFNFYNRALSTSEIMQNYIAMKGRFNL